MPNLITHVCGTHKSVSTKWACARCKHVCLMRVTAQYLLIKAPPASGKSRALMYIGLDKIVNQGLKKIIVAVPERSIGNSFKTTLLKPSGFFADWLVSPKYNLTTVGGGNKTEAVGEFLASDETILVCTHATLRFAYDKLGAAAFAECVVAIDEFHHTSADAESKLGELVRGLIADGRPHVVAMTGSYFRGDTIPVLRPEDEDRFARVTYTYYEQLASYQYLKTLGIGYHFYSESYLKAIERGTRHSRRRRSCISQASTRPSRRWTRCGKSIRCSTTSLAAMASSMTRDDSYRLLPCHAARRHGLKVADLVDDSPYREKVLDEPS